MLEFIDFHIHPAYSIDAKGNMEDFVNCAINKGLSAICFTTHIDLNPFRKHLDQWMIINNKKVPLSDNSVNLYLKEIKSLKAKYSDKIRIFSGFEFSYEIECEDETRHFIEKFPTDFNIGSVHCMENIGFSISNEFEYIMGKYSPEQFLIRYFSEIQGLIKSKLFSTIGHIDGYKKYANSVWNIHEMHLAEKRFYPDIFQLMNEYKIGFEINTAAFFKGFKENYPSNRILEIAKENKAFINSFGSDAHKPDRVGALIPEAYKLAEEIGIDVKLFINNSTE